jgi:hypothetical protein
VACDNYRLRWSNEACVYSNLRRPLALRRASSDASLHGDRESFAPQTFRLLRALASPRFLASIARGLAEACGDTIVRVTGAVKTRPGRPETR